MSDFLSSGSNWTPPSPERAPAIESRLIGAGAPEAALAYAVDAMPGFEALKSAISLLAGLLILDLVGAERTVRDRSLEARACETLDEAEAAIRSANVPAAMAHHHQHVCRALALAKDAAADIANAPARIGADGRDAVIAVLRGALNELGYASRLLPGFELVDFSQSCCGFHARQMAALAGRN